MATNPVKQLDAFESGDANADETIQVLRLRDVCAMTGLCRSSVYEMEADGRFPARINIGPRAVGWVKSDVQGWLRARIAARSKRAPRS